ncbi:MAG: PASTA domain-containing protein [Erysipelotrichaceae bacterium]|nr:PASTA domain-containing protein [Erysipelotrichaceae bacterium]
MYCINCGKEILESDKFCPFCGAASKKKISIESNISIDALKKRGTMFLEDGDFETAAEYFERVLDLDPENADAYLAKLMIKTKQKNLPDLLDYYKNLYNKREPEEKEAQISIDYDHINSFAKKYAVPGYLSEPDIVDIYEKYSRNYSSEVQPRENQKLKIEDEFNNEKLISRIKEYANKELSGKFDNVLKEYDKRVKEAKKSEKENKDKVLKEYPDFIKQTDERIKKEHKELVQKRKQDYKEYLNDFDRLKDIEDVSIKKNEFQLLKNKLDALEDYEEAKDYVEKCNRIIEELENKEKALKEEKDRKKRRLIVAVSAMLMLLLAAGIYYNNVIIPNRKYEQAEEFLENRKYDEAIKIFNSLNGYKDSKERVIETKYNKASTLLDEKKYEEAISIFKETEGYEDSVEKKTEAIYEWGKELLENKEYDKAALEFGLIKEYQDSSELIYESRYQKAANLLENEEYDESIRLYNELGEYKDSAMKKGEAEKIKAANTFVVPDLYNTSIKNAKNTLNKMKVEYTVTQEESKTIESDYVIRTNPSRGTTAKKGTVVQVYVSIGSSEMVNYPGDGNTTVLFRIRITEIGNNVKVRTTPSTKNGNANKVGNVHTGEEYNVYETVTNEGYTWYRIGVKRWMATDGTWAAIIYDGI